MRKVLREIFLLIKQNKTIKDQRKEVELENVKDEIRGNKRYKMKEVCKAYISQRIFTIT